MKFYSLQKKLKNDVTKFHIIYLKKITKHNKKYILKKRRAALIEKVEQTMTPLIIQIETLTVIMTRLYRARIAWFFAGNSAPFPQAGTAVMSIFDVSANATIFARIVSATNIRGTTISSMKIVRTDAFVVVNHVLYAAKVSKTLSK